MGWSGRAGRSRFSRWRLAAAEQRLCAFKSGDVLLKLNENSTLLFKQGTECRWRGHTLATHNTSAASCQGDRLGMSIARQDVRLFGFWYRLSPPLTAELFRNRHGPAGCLMSPDPCLPGLGRL